MTGIYASTLVPVLLTPCVAFLPPPPTISSPSFAVFPHTIVIPLCSRLVPLTIRCCSLWSEGVPFSKHIYPTMQVASFMLVRMLPSKVNLSSVKSCSDCGSAEPPIT
ncbi:hypothetical protein FOXYSP1_06568 [Fusarium oxysporum f. sp. phaseoli]